MVDHELLVHISTSATRQNDQLYRSLADAYLDFETHRSHGDSSPQEQHDESSQYAGTDRVSSDEVLEDGNSFQGNLNTSILSTSKDSYGSFPSDLSSEKHYDNADAGEDELPPPSSRLARLERIHQNWKAQVTPRSSAASKQRVTKDGPSSEEDEDIDTAFIEDTQVAVQDLQSQMPDSFEMGFEDTDEEEEGEEAGNGMQEMSWELTELEEGATTTTAEARQGQLEDSSPISWDDSSMDDLDAGGVTQGISSSPAEPAEPPIATTPEEPTLPRATLPSKVTTASVTRRKSARLEEARSAAQVKAPVPSQLHSGFSSFIPERQGNLHPSEASKAAASFKVPTPVTNRRKSARLQEASTPNPKPPIPSTQLLSSNTTTPDHQSASRPPLPFKPPTQPSTNNQHTTTAHAPVPPSQPIDFSLLPYSVLAPEPKIGIETPPCLPSQITPYLASLKTRYRTLFQPRKQLYVPANDTRGWWEVDCMGWPGGEQIKFWKAVCEVLGDGRLGWATSLHREIGGVEEEEERMKGLDVKGLDVKGLGVVRLYSWGELVEHMWLVLWVCSEGKVEGTGCRWVEAGGRVVVEMS